MGVLTIVAVGAATVVIAITVLLRSRGGGELTPVSEQWFADQKRRSDW